MADISTGALATATLLNTIFKPLATGAALAGSPPAAGEASGFSWIAGDAIVTTSGSGDGVYTFPAAFPNGLLYFTVSNGPINQLLIPYGDPGGAIPPSRTQIAFRAFTFPGLAAITSSAIRFNFFAIGF